MNINELIEKGTVWIMTVVGLSLVIAGFVLFEFYASSSKNPDYQLSIVVYALLYISIGFELLFFSRIMIPMSNWFGRQFKRLERKEMKA